MLDARLFFALSLALLVGCTSDKDDEDDDDGADSGSADGGDGGDGGSSDGVSPWILSGFGYCEDSGGSAGTIFFFEIQADDPQGTFTLDGLRGWLAGYENSGTEVFRDEGIACQGDGLCQHSFNDGHHSPITCSSADQYYFKAAVEDDDGHFSEPFRLDWNG